MIKYEYVNDGYFAEIKESEMFKDRMEIYRAMKDNGMIGTVYSMDYVNKHILKLNDNEIERERETIQQEIDSGIIPDPKAKQDDDGGF